MRGICAAELVCTAVPLLGMGCYNLMSLVSVVLCVWGPAEGGRGGAVGCDG